jgi:hypothetical protein
MAETSQRKAFKMYGLKKGRLTIESDEIQLLTEVTMGYKAD